MAILLGSLSGGMQPSAPTIGTATAGDTTASVAFTPSTYIGKGTITYTATSSPGGFTGTSATSPITVSGLTNGTAYTFTVVGTTNYGVSSLASAASNSITPASATSFESIATYTATGSVSDITFSSIPSTYKILQFRMMVRDASSSIGDRSIFAQFNGDTSTSNYAWNRIYSYPGTNSYGLDFSNTTGSAFAGITIANATTPTDDYGGNIFEIIDYADTSKTKQTKQYGGSSQSQFDSASRWAGTAAINSVRFFCSGGASFKINSTIALYGIKG